MAINSACRVRVQWYDVGVSCLLLAANLMLICCGAGTAEGAPTGTFPKLFTFGDSYVDTGNRDPNNSTATPIGPVNQAWRVPYGRTRPGTPAGHFSDGDVLSEFLGKYMGLTPATYMLYLSNTSIPIGDGMNFAVGGSGVFDNLGFTKTRDQIAQFKALVDANVYNNASVFNESVILFAISGNDYAAALRSLDVLNVVLVTTAVVDQMVRDLKSLYDMGFKNFVISELPPLDCLPAVTATIGYTACVTPITIFPTTHNLYLNKEIAANFPPSTGANVILLENQKSFNHILINNSSASGLLPETFPLKPCCVAEGLPALGNFCGDLDDYKNPRYELCSSSCPSPFFWDEVHPTEAGWRKVFNLYVTKPSFTHDRSLPAFLGVP